MKGNVIETVIGAVVIAIAVGFFTFVYKTADIRAGTGGYTLKANFESVDGITTGSDVRVSGIKVGSVVEQRLDTETFEAAVVFAIDRDVKLPADSSAKVTSEGLLGDKYIAIDPGGDEEMLADGGTIEHTQGALDLFGMISQFLFTGDDKKQDNATQDTSQ
ncbi:MAG: outer membrane lipid asymmetry maintenance protein MlaD [Hyphomicrobiales bacterium]